MQSLDERIEQIEDLLHDVENILSKTLEQGLDLEYALYKKEELDLAAVRFLLLDLKQLPMDEGGRANPYRVEWAKKIRLVFIEDSLDSGIGPERLHGAIRNRTDPDWWIRNRHAIGIVPIVSQLTGPGK